MKKNIILIITVCIILFVTIYSIFHKSSDEQSHQENQTIVSNNEQKKDNNNPNNSVNRDEQNNTAVKDESTNYEFDKKIQDYIKERNINTENIAISYKNFKTGETFGLNDNKYFTAASTYKLYLAVIYYDMISKNSISEDSYIVFEKHMYQTGGSISSLYNIGSKIKLSEILDYMIIESDNSAGHILFENLGGWNKFKDLASEYVTVEKDKNYNSNDNVVTSKFLSDFLEVIYKDKDKYSKLIENLKIAEPKAYLNYNLGMSEIYAQKYGEYDNAINAAGLSFDSTPFSIVVLTQDLSSAYKTIGDIGQIAYEYTNSINTEKENSQ